MCAIIIIRMTLIADYPSPRSVIRISVKGDQIDREGWSVYLKYTPLTVAIYKMSSGHPFGNQIPQVSVKWKSNTFV